MADHKHPVILIAEDDADARFMLRRAFDQLGLDTPLQFVRDGEQAMAYLAGEGIFANRGEYPVPDLLLLDLKMPRKSGFDVLEWLQKQPTLSALRTVVLTTSEDIYEINRAYRSGASSFLTKPINFSEFRDTIHAIYRYWIDMNRTPDVSRPGSAGGSIRLPSKAG